MLEHLFAPLRVGPATIPNRIVSTSHQTSLVHDHLPTDDLIAYHEARARGGAGLICVEATAIHHTGLLTPHTLGGYLPEIVPAYRRLAGAVHAHGTKLMVQLFHGGREVISAPPRPPAVAPSSVPSARFKTEPRALTRREIHEMLDGYRQAAAYGLRGRRGRRRGLCGVRLPAHAVPVPALQPPHRRVRRHFENRLRFLREVCEAMRDGIGAGGVVGCRLTDEHWSFDANDEDDLRRAAAELADAGLIDYLSVALGSSSTYRGSTWIVPPVPSSTTRCRPSPAA
jgi:2,4-dienoyl-CoA reductase-like NADH-dependent reductase (Old Yellow Enzyme family)